MARVRGIDPSDADPKLQAVFDAQVAAWGAPLEPYLDLRPAAGRLPRGARRCGTRSMPPVSIDGPLKALVCRRVASLNGCPF